MESGIIPSSSVTASAFQAGYEPTHARVNDTQGWYTPERTSSSDYLQIDTGALHYITTVATQVGFISFDENGYKTYLRNLTRYIE